MSVYIYTHIYNGCIYIHTQHIFRVLLKTVNSFHM